MVKSASEIWRRYVTAGVPSSGGQEPNKGDIVDWGSYLETILAGTGTSLVYTSLTSLNADLAHAANTAALVSGDATPGNNGLYMKVGISGTGSWTRVGDLPSSVVRMTVTGGTANAIVATAPETPTNPDFKIFILTPSATNTGATTIALNGGAAIAVKNSLDAALVANNLVNGTPVAMIWKTDHYQLLVSVSVDTAGVVADAVAAKVAAEAAAATAAASAAAASSGPGGRLTLASGQPVMAASVTAATTLYYAPFTGTSIPVNTGGTIALKPFTSSPTDIVGLSIVLGANWTASTNYDVFGAMDGATLRLGTGPSWAAGAVAGSNSVGASTRGTGAGSTELQMYKGYMTNKNSITLRYANASTFTAAANEATYLGSFRTGSAGQISFVYGDHGVAGSFNLWNCYNQVQLGSTSADGTASWNYTTATTRQANASAINQFNFMVGLASGAISARAVQTVRTAAAVGANTRIGVALNSTTVFDKQAQVTSQAAAQLDTCLSVDVEYKPQLGANFISMNERGDGTNASTIFGQLFQQLSIRMMG